MPTLSRFLESIIAAGLGLLVGILIGSALVEAFAQPMAAPVNPPESIPPWVVRYAQGQDDRARQCEMKLAQEQDRIGKLEKELAELKAAKKPEEKK